jgi:hypothetical protein
LQGTWVSVVSSARLIVLTLSAAALVAAAGQACAQPETAGVVLAANDFAAPNYGPAGPVTTGRTLEWDSRKGRWGLKLGVEQHTDRLSEWRDVQPGVYFKVTPRLHIGGAVSLNPNPQVDPYVAEPRPSTPRVRLETTFKF